MDKIPKTIDSLSTINFENSPRNPIKLTNSLDRIDESYQSSNYYTGFTPAPEGLKPTRINQIKIKMTTKNSKKLSELGTSNSASKINSMPETINLSPNRKMDMSIKVKMPFVAYQAQPLPQT